MIASKQNMVKQAIGVVKMKIMKKMKRYQTKVSPINELIIDKTKIKNLNFINVLGRNTFYKILRNKKQRRNYLLI